MVNIFIGAFMMAGFLFILKHSRKQKLHITWWQWILTILCFVYALFVLETIISFLAEGAAKAALVMGVILGLIAAVWGVLLGRFVFARKARR
jgi:lipopolysaccharide export LptBFGC system permease protein LptF